jgi:hypothetical protein
MRPLNLEEFAQEMRRGGDIRQADMADEILALIDIEEEVAEPYSNLCDDLNNVAPDGLTDKPEKQMEWVIDRSNLLEEIEDELREKGKAPEGTADTADAVKELLGTMAEAEAILEAAGWPGTDFIEALQGLAERAARAPEEIEVMTYDL